MALSKSTNLINKNKNKSIVETTIANQSGSDGYDPLRLHLCWFWAVGQFNTGPISS